jgi:hypothetical protein
MNRFVLVPLSALVAGIVGFALATNHVSFLWLAVILGGAVVALGIVTTAVVMNWPKHDPQPQGNPAGWF